MEYETVKMLNAIERHIDRRSGIEAQNYVGNLSGLRADRREIARDGRDCRIMLRYLRRCYQLPADTMRRAFQAYGGRLAYDWDKNAVEYTAGQYWPTEYRVAAGAVLARAFRLHMTQNVTDGMDKTLFARLCAERELGRGIARRWFA